MSNILQHNHVMSYFCCLISVSEALLWYWLSDLIIIEWEKRRVEFNKAQ